MKHNSIPFLLATSEITRGGYFTSDIADILSGEQEKNLAYPMIECHIQPRKFYFATEDGLLAKSSINLPIDPQRDANLGSFLINPLRSACGDAFTQEGISLIPDIIDAMFWNETNSRGHIASSRFKTANRLLDKETRDFLRSPPPGGFLVIVVRADISRDEAYSENLQKAATRSVMHQFPADFQTADHVRLQRTCNELAQRVAELNEEVQGKQGLVDRFAGMATRSYMKAKEDIADHRRAHEQALERARNAVAQRNEMQGQRDKYKMQRDKARQERDEAWMEVDRLEDENSDLWDHITLRNRYISRLEDQLKAATEHVKTKTAMDLD